jgi:peroxiredoxin
MISVGSKAPDFVLEDQNGKIVKLSSLKGRKVPAFVQTFSLDSGLP